MEGTFFARARKTSLTFLKNKNFTSGQKHRERIGNAFPKHPKTSKTDQNSKSYPKKTEGWAYNSWTQFTSLLRNLVRTIYTEGPEGPPRPAGVI